MDGEEFASRGALLGDRLNELRDSLIGEVEQDAFDDRDGRSQWAETGGGQLVESAAREVTAAWPPVDGRCHLVLGEHPLLIGDQLELVDLENDAVNSDDIFREPLTSHLCQL